MTAPTHVALIGCGFTGTSALFQLVDRHPVKEITVFEASGEFGPGYPYHLDECQDYLLNNTTDTLCLVPSYRRAFLDWLRERPALAPELDPKGHLPRSLYGQFLKHAVDTACTIANIKGIHVRLIPFEATSLREDRQGRVHIVWSAGTTTADVAILTTGRCPPLDACPTPPAGAPARYIANHINSDTLDSLAPDASVHVLGASLSAYDVVNRLFSPQTSSCRFERTANGELRFIPGNNRRRVVLCSRSGRLKAVQSRRPMAIRRRYLTLERLREIASGDTGNVSFDDLATLLQREAEQHGVALDWPALTDPYADCVTAADVNARAGRVLAAALNAATKPNGANFLVDLLADAQRDLWDAFAERLLTADDERRYRQTLETAVLCYAAPCPAATAEKLLALHRAGRLAVMNQVSRVTLAENNSAYLIEHARGVERAAVLINTTGSVDREVQSPRQPALIQSLAQQELLKPYRRDGIELRGAAVDMASFRASGARHIYLANMLLWGPGFFTSSALMMATIVERLLNGLFDDR